MQSVIARETRVPSQAQGASSTAEFYFKAQAQADGSTPDLLIQVPIKQVLDPTLGHSRTFLLRVGGYINAQAGTTPDFQVRLDAGNDASFANNTTIADSGSIVLDNDTTRQSFFLEAELLLSPNDSKLQGLFRGWVNNTAVAQTVLVESVEDLIAGGVLYFKVSGQMSESIASQTAVVTFFEVVAG